MTVWATGWPGSDPIAVSSSAVPRFRFARSRYVRHGSPGLWHRVRSAHIIWRGAFDSPVIIVDLCCGPSRRLSTLEPVLHLCPGPRCWCTWVPHPDPRGPVRPQARTILWP